MNDRTVKLLKSHRVRIARALVRQTRAMAPRYEQLEPAAQERSFLALLIAVERLLEMGDEGPLLDAASHLAQLRASMGFRIDDFATASLSFLPVIRRFIVEHAKDAREGLDAYEEFEAIALPFIGRTASIFLDASEDPTVPGARATQSTHTLREGKRIVPMRIERVTGDDREETDIDLTPFRSIM